MGIIKKEYIMKVFDKEGFKTFCSENYEVNIDGVDVDSVIDESGVYCLHFGSRGEVDFGKVNLSIEITEWSKLEKDEFVYVGNESCDLGYNYLDLSWGEESLKCYFIIRGVQ